MHQRIGVILARFQPIHMGHIELIHQAYQENDLIYIFIGSSTTTNERNPFPYTTRSNLLITALQDYDLWMKTKVIALPDLFGEQNNSLTWGFYLYANIIRSIKQDSFNMYYGDSASTIATWFTEYILKNHIHLHYVDRTNPVSSTIIREKILQGASLEGLVPNAVIEQQVTLERQIREFISESPKEH